MRYDIATGSSAAAQVANADVLNIAAGATSGYVLRRILVGARVDGGAAPANTLLVLGVYRSTNRGTPTATQAPEKKQGLQEACPIAGADNAWSVALTAGNQLWVITFNAQTPGLDLPFEGDDGIRVPPDANNGLLFRNLANALPANHRYQLTLTIET